MRVKSIIHKETSGQNRRKAKGEWLLLSLVAFGLVILRSDSTITPNGTWLSEWYSASANATVTAFSTATAWRSDSDGDSDSDSYSYSYSYLYQIDRNNTKNFYSWNGNLWMPPRNIPSLSGSEIQRLFATENTLWIGDSTARQDMQTMYTTVGAKDPNNVPITEVNKYINNGKLNFYHPGQDPPHHCPRRTPLKICHYPCAGGVEFQEMAQVFGTGSGCESSDTSDNNNVDNNNADNNNVDNNNNENDDPFAIGKFDYTKFVCFDLVADWIQEETTTATIRSGYTVLVLSLGIWEAVKTNCDDADANTTKEEREVRLLEALRVISGPDLLVLVKTIGPSQEEVTNQGTRSRELNRAARDWFQSATPEYMDLVDFGGVLVAQDRVFNEKRIGGDILAHWGFEARALSNGMVAHAVLLNQERRQKQKRKRKQ